MLDSNRIREVPVLSDEDKARIEAEERYRAEVRAKLTPQPTGRAPYAAQAQPEAQPVVNDTVAGLSTTTWWYICGCLALVVLFVFLLRPSESPSPSTARSYDWADLASDCESIVKNNLKAPGTARFPDPGEQRDAIGDGLVWEGWVDSENNFGALLRRHFICTGDLATRIVRVTFTD
jgi:hypothetical protein